MQKPLIYSASLHVTAIALMILGLPPSDRKLEMPDSIPVELVSLGDVTEAARVDEGEESPDPPAPPPPSVKPTPPQPPAPAPAQKVESTPPPPPKAPEPPKTPPPPAPREPQQPPPPPPPPKTPEPPKPEPPKPEPPKPEPPKPAPTPEPVPKAEHKPEPPKPEPPKPEPPKPEPKKPEPPKPEPKKPEPPKPEPKKPEPPKPEPKKPTQPEDPLAKLLGDVVKMPTTPSQASNAASSNSRQTSSAKPSGAKTATPGPEREFKPSGKATDAIRSQLSKLWNVDTGRRNDGDMKVTIHVEVDRDGSVLSARMDDASLARAASDRAYRASAEAAVRAVLRAQKLNLLPDEFTAATYQNWRKFVFTFDPRDMF